jgi:hypothetical protein
MNKNDFVSDRRLYLDKDNNVVEANDPNKLTLLVAEGGSLSAEEAAKYGLGVEEAATEESTEEAEASDDSGTVTKTKKAPAKGKK